MEKQNQNSVCLILDNIRSVHNVGSIFRTADAAGVSMIYLVGTTPTPIDRFEKKRKDFIKTSLGAEDSVPWKYTKKISSTIKKLQSKGCVVLSLEQTPDSISYTKIQSKLKNKKIALIVGNEVGGVSKQALTLSDFCIEIPMKGVKESLNVSVSTGIALYRILNI